MKTAPLVFLNLCFTQNFEETERIYKMSLSIPTNNGMLKIFSFLFE